MMLFQLKTTFVGPVLSTVKFLVKVSVSENARTSICKPLFHAPVNWASTRLNPVGLVIVAGLA